MDLTELNKESLENKHEELKPGVAFAPNTPGSAPEPHRYEAEKTTQRLLLAQPHEDRNQNGACTGIKTFEDIFHIVGHKGRFQILLLVVIFFSSCNVNLQNFNTIFTLTIPAHR